MNFWQDIVDTVLDSRTSLVPHIASAIREQDVIPNIGVWRLGFGVWGLKLGVWGEDFRCWADGRRSPFAPGLWRDIPFN